jgi:signal transduction histidine kinase
LEIERREDKDQVDEWIDRQQATERIKGDAVEENITKLHQKMEREGDLPKYEGDLKTLRTRYREMLESLVDPLIVAAGLGISYTIPVHEITRNVKDLRSSLRTVRESAEPREVFEKLDQALTILEQIDEMVRGAGRIIRRGRPENVRLFSAVKDAVDIMRLRLGKEGIAIKTREIEPLQVRGRRNLIVTAILNLIDNSAYWLLLNEKDKQVVITVDRSPAGEPRIVVADNGPGIQDDPALLVKPFFTRKPDGSGLGLYIVDRIMQAHDGGVFFLSDETGDDSLLDGANVALVFPPEKEVE